MLSYKKKTAAKQEFESTLFILFFNKQADTCYKSDGIKIETDWF